MKQRKILKVVVFALLIVFTLVITLNAAGQKEKGTEAGGKKLPSVGISTGSSGTTWRNEMIDALKMVGDEYKAAGKIKDYKLVNNVTNGDATEQANIIRNFISQGVDIIMLNPNSPDALNGVIKEAQDAGILVLAFDATVTAPDVINVTVNHYDWMKRNVEWICKTLQKGNVIDIYGLPSHPANKAREKAVHDVLKNYPDVKLIASTSGFWDETKAKEAATQIIASGKQIDGVITQDGMAYGVLTAFLDANKLPKVMFGDPGTAFFKLWKKLRDDHADFKACTQVNPPGVGGTAFRIALRLYNGRKFKPGVLKDNIYYIKISLFVTDDNFDEAWEMLKDKPDSYLLNEVMPEDEVEALFQ